MKSKLYRVLLGIFFPILFISLFFLFGGTEHGATCWIGCIFALLSYAFAIIAPRFVPRSKSSRLFGITCGSLTSIYFGINFVLGLIFMIWDFEQWKIAIAFEAVLFAAFLALFSPLLLADEKTAEKENKQQKEIYAVKTLVSKCKMISERTSDLQMKKSVLRVYDELNFCPSTTNTDVKSIDGLISSGLEKLEQAVVSNNNDEINSLVSELIILIKERKELSKY